MAGISPSELAAQIESGHPPVVLDVRSSREFAQGHVPGALHMPFQMVRSRTTALPFDRSAPIVVYCAHGPRAWLAGAALRRRGFTQVVYLAGHMRAWRRGRLPQE